MTGLDLKLQRVAADVKAKDLASSMGVTSSYVSRIENRRTITPEQTERYLAALRTCVTNSTRPTAA